MGWDTKKTVTISAITVLGVVGTLIGIFNDIIDLSGKKSEKDNTVERVVETIIITEKVTEDAVYSEEIDESKEIEDNYADVVEEVLVPDTEAQPTAVYLDNLKVTESHGFYENENTAEDTVGNIYSAHTVTIGNVGVLDTGGDAYAMYYLGGKYKTLTGTIAVNDRTREEGSGEILIFCDDNVIYQTGAVGRATAPISLPNLNIEGCQWLKISEPTYNGQWDKDINFILSDWKLE